MQNSGPQITLLTGKLVIFKITIKHIHRDRDLGAFSSDDLRPNFRRSRHRIIPSVSKGAILGKFDPVIFGRAPPTRPARAIFSDMMTFVIDETHGVKVRSTYSQLNSRVRHTEVGWRLHRQFGWNRRSRGVAAGRSVDNFGSFDPDRIDRHPRRCNPRVGQQCVMCDGALGTRYQRSRPSNLPVSNVIWRR